MPLPKSSRPDTSTSSSVVTANSVSVSSVPAASAMLPQGPSKTGILPSDHFASRNTPLPAPTTSHAATHDLGVAAPTLHNSPLGVSMGQNYSKPLAVHKGLSISTAAANTGFKLKRAFGARRKKSEDSTALFDAANSKGKETEWDSPISPPSSSPQVTTPPSKFPRPTILTQFAAQIKSNGKKASSPQQVSPIPPTPPPKPSIMLTSKIPSSLTSPYPPLPAKAHPTIKADNRGSIIPMSPGISSAVNFMRMGEEERAAALEREKDAEKSDDQKDVWRKSDSTMSHHTIRPGAGAGPRSSRPVSMAESLQSNHTVVPVNKRLSARITDAEFVPPEEEDDDASFESASEVTPSAPHPTPLSSTVSPNAKNRRSMSLNLGSKSAKVALPSPPVTTTGPDNHIVVSKSYPESHHRTPQSSSSEMATLTRAAANGIIAPSSSGVQTTGNNIRGRLAAWTATNPPPSQNPHHTSRQVPPSAYHRSTPSPQPHQRTAAISITGSLAPAANLARRAAEKLGRWGGFSSSSGGSGYSSSSSSTGYSSDHGLGRTTSRTSSGQVSSGRGKQRRTPDAPSGAWSVSSAGGSTSDSDAFPIPTGPSLGSQIRGSLRVNAGGALVASGIVFGRNLALVVKETAVGVGIPNYRHSFDQFRPVMETPGVMTKEEWSVLETRRLPALVVRCAQHLLLWGVGEEGLFRLSGRPSHVSKLRQEFDTGADYNLQECSLGELDPHAVASVFKAFLRELPEPLLTHALLPYFDAALTHENAANEQQQQEHPLARPIAGQRGPSLPTGPKSGLQAIRKPPSLSTLAMPNFSGMRPPSRSLINALKSLVSQLPDENRDLIKTVTELIKATAKESRQTKMPLSNLLLVFCPSLNMNPPLLRVLCEADEIWEVEDVVSVLDIRREDEVLDISPISDTGDATPLDEMDIVVLQPKVVHETLASTPSRAHQDEAPPSLERKRTIEERARSKKPLGPRRAAHIPAVVHVDAQNTTFFADNEALHRPSSPDVMSESLSVPDDSSSTSTSDTRSDSESLTTSTSSAEPSLAHLPIPKLPPDESNSLAKPEIAGEDITAPRGHVDHIRSGIIQFPSTSDHSPSTPVSPRMSAPSLLFPAPPSSPSLSSDSVPPSPRARRIKKPSLQLLFSKRSVSRLDSPTASEGKSFISSPITSPYLPAASISSGSTVSTPLSAVTAPQSSTFTLPPVIDTTFESSPLKFGLGLDPQLSPEMVAGGSSKRQQPQAEVEEEEAVSAPVGETPIANRYCTPSSSTLSLQLPDSDNQKPSHLRPYPTLRSRQASSSSSLSTTSSNHLGLLGDNGDQEDWTQSVLLAADAEAPWKLS
ncbi:hypothetical protein D9757_000536 [Collybiopsis confluens]|uniref:Rho-GAP domain-containing protein n=1 Tax=Collybiopsis confluens TaxID=2823264 RepID=A0A8H5MGL8_9AGAR|nr:hypothetical protein D9757_000536 [Collybiopsis confluens]